LWMENAFRQVLHPPDVGLNCRGLACGQEVKAIEFLPARSCLRSRSA
jgi:hypothetical protein